MTGTQPDEDRVLEVWNRAAQGAVGGGRQGDRALADALLLHGAAEADGLLAAVEQEDEDERAGRGSAGLLWLGLTEAAALVDEVTTRWVDLTGEGEPGEGSDVLDERARQAALDALEAESGERWAALGVEDALDAALRHSLARRPEAFAVATSAEEVAGAPPAPAGWGVDIPEEEKLRRSAQAFEAFGLRAVVERGSLVVWPPDEPDAWDLADELHRLLDLRYPPRDG